MKRREFITLLGGAAAAPIFLSVAANAQPGRMRRIGVLLAGAETDPELQAQVSAFRQGLEDLGWTEGRNIQMDMKWAGGTVDRLQTFAKALIDPRPDVILAHTTPITAAFQRETTTTSVVFVNVSDPVGDGFVASLPRPGGNITGFINLESSMGGKWLELLKEVAPGVIRAAMLFNPDVSPGAGTYFLHPFEAAATSLGLNAISSPVRMTGDIESALSRLGREPGSGLVVAPGGGFTGAHRGLIISLAARLKVPAVYSQRTFATDGGLLSYGPHYPDLFRRAASYVDRVLRGATTAELPVQVPTKFEMVINLKTAKALGLTIPESFLLRADEVIE
jgi:putative ABC transport system substrate-binding protein